MNKRTISYEHILDEEGNLKYITLVQNGNRITLTLSVRTCGPITDHWHDVKQTIDKMADKVHKDVLESVKVYEKETISD